MKQLNTLELRNSIQITLQTIDSCNNLQNFNTKKEDVSMIKMLKQNAKNKFIDDNHPYKITEPTKKNQRFMTYFKPIDGKGDRIKIVAPTKEALYQKLCNYYFVKPKLTLSSLYEEWEVRRKKLNISDRTINRNYNDWVKYYIPHKIAKQPLSTITSKDIEDFFNESIKKYNMTSKQVNNMKIIIKDILHMATRNGYISTNPFINAEISFRSCYPPNKKPDDERIYLPEEKAKIITALNKEILEFPNQTDAHAILLLFYIGVRIGELVAIKKSDIDFEKKTLHIHRTETIINDENGKSKVVVANHTKKKSPYGDRYIPLTENSIQIINQVLEINKKYSYSDDDFLFVDQDGRTKIREIDNRIRKMCRNANIPTKSAHNIRRTVASQLKLKGIDINTIAKFMGHSDTNTTLKYIYNLETETKTHQSIIKALED